MNKQPPTLQVSHLSVTYPHQNIPTLKDINIHVNKGEIVLVIGPSGCRKSTLATCLNGLIPKHIKANVSGHITMNGLDTQTTTTATLAKHVGLLFQDPLTQLVTDSVELEVAFGLENLQTPPLLMQATVDRALAQFHLQKQRKTDPRNLSVGEQQRLALASVVALDPDVLVLDEPTASLDGAEREEFILSIAASQRHHPRAIILIEHYIDEWLPFLDRVVVLTNDGSLLLNDTPKNIFCNEIKLLEKMGVWVPQMAMLSAKLDHGKCALTIPEWKERLQNTPFIMKRNETQLSIKEEIAIEIRELSFANNETTYLSNISLQVPKGCLCALIGPNGAGKTTLLRHFVHNPKPTPRSIWVHGLDLAKLTFWDLHNTIGYGFQNPEHSLMKQSVLDELCSTLQHQNDSPQRRGELAYEIAKEFGLSECLSTNPFLLSQGQKQRLQLASLLVRKPSILLLDEPTVGLDRANTLFLFEQLQTFCKQGGTVLFVTHHMELVAEFADLAAVLVDGRLEYNGTPDQLFVLTDLLKKANLRRPPIAELSFQLQKQPLSRLYPMKMKEMIASLSLEKTSHA